MPPMLPHPGGSCLEKVAPRPTIRRCAGSLVRRRKHRVRTGAAEMNTSRDGDVWALVHAERAALVADLADLRDEQWATPSLCAGLSVREVLAHLTASASMGAFRWLAGVIRCR